MSVRGLLDIIWLLFLLSMLRHFWYERQNLTKTNGWLITKGRIVRFEWTHENHRIWPRISYTYQVFDQDFQSEYLFLDTAHNSPYSYYARRVAYRAAIAYEKNEAIDVYYNPNDPQQAVLDITIPRKLNWIIALLLGLIALHLAIVAAHLLGFLS
nr:DUF3592 domain-containing protein [Legionella fairfieldensis]